MTVWVFWDPINHMGSRHRHRSHNTRVIIKVSSQDSCMEIPPEGVRRWIEEVHIRTYSVASSQHPRYRTVVRVFDVVVTFSKQLNTASIATRN
ncbi:hypothetical protein J6590_080501, partial [Homalodisca vitripennis]